ncbi:uncharacterized protein BCR38DRAFT_436439 [Pseudomassariella vexata]|uniref:Uncharacterized protein n=1 Tax=Pseudomassariella vexata TaxID=1141098 RepID=A0A1Y2DVL1_9PEZI|nr:uncharacterized protein BCR38DRAFT_436439 [Pseudomassariella vexata]ORY63293.1 hypothetical protein BCR38DRAFT_436439 [Pseudomassariella vexata]
MAQWSMPRADDIYMRLPGVDDRSRRNPRLLRILEPGDPFSKTSQEASPPSSPVIFHRSSRGGNSGMPEVDFVQLSPCLLLYACT